MFINTRPGSATPQMVVAQATTPTNPTTGMIWIDTANNHFQYIRTATSWVSAPDYQIGTGTYEWASVNGVKQLAFPPFLTAIGRPFEIDLLFYSLNAQLSTPNNASNYWSFQLRTRPGAVTGTQFDPTDVVTSGAVVWRQFTQDLRGSTAFTAGQFLSMILTFAGAPGYVIFNASVSYRIRLL